jgi:hypothetical protein
MIKLKRDSGFTDRFRAYQVVLDGAVIAEIKNGKEIEFHATPGKHSVFLSIDWCRSNPVEFENSGADVELECGSNSRGAKVFSALKNVTSNTDQYIWLKKKDIGVNQ